MLASFGALAQNVVSGTVKDDNGESLVGANVYWIGTSTGVTTNVDGKFSIETVYCLGACGLAPVVFVGDKVHGQSTPKTAVEFIKSIDD